MSGEARTAGVVLAAGRSTRMGRNKLMLEVGGETLVARAVRTAAAGGLDPVIVVLGHEAARVESALDGLACRAVFNPDHARGQGTSFRAGIAAVPSDAGAAVVVLADMPRVTPEMIRALLERHRSGNEPLVVSEYGGVHAPPTLYGRALFPRILAASGCGRDVVREHRAEAAVVAWPAGMLADVDEPADLERLRENLASVEKVPCAPTS
ncbi:MAG TPA: nucleotidyltransferase family protein [Thermoanaerobaculia bacterium]|nr:nucleotidyltransferase family protein [Thermoanaerobaculia bacterium]